MNDEEGWMDGGWELGMWERRKGEKETGLGWVVVVTSRKYSDAAC